MQTGSWHSFWGRARASLLTQNHWFVYLSLISGLFLGLAIIELGPLKSLGIIVCFIAIMATFRYPEVMVLLIIGYASELIPAQFNYHLQMAGRNFFLTDFLFFLLIAIVIVKLLMDKNFRLVKTPLDVPLLIFAVAIVIGVATATLNHNVKFSDTTPDARVLLYYLIFFPVTNLIRSEGQLNRLIRGLFLIGILVALMMVAQAIIGPSINMAGQSESTFSGEVMRFFNPGFVAVYLSLMVLLCGLIIQAHDPRRYVKLALIIVLSTALLLTGARNLLFSMAISLGVLAILLPKRQLPRLVVTAIYITAIASGILAAFQVLGIGSKILGYLTAYIGRINHLFTTSVLSPEETLAWRWNEYHYAWPKLLENPILGIGLHTPYRPPFYVGDTGIGYIHNAYLSLWLKTGLLGLSAFLWLSYRFLSRGFRNWRSISDSFLRATVLGLTLMYLGMVISNLVAPSLVQDFNTTVFGVMLGISEVIYSFQSSGQASIKGAFHYG